MTTHEKRRPALPMPVKATPYRHQQEAFDFVCRSFGLLPEPEAGPPATKSSGCALLMEMGTGKTITSIAITGALAKDGRIGRVLIVAPLSILGVWEAEFARFADFPYFLAVLSGTGAKKLDTLRHMTGAALQVAAVNYESAWRMEKDLLAWRPGLIIADEGHKIKTHNIAASKAMHRLGRAASYRLLLTGTVITNKAIDVFSQYKFTNPAIFGQSFYAFRSRYFDMVGYGNHTPVLKKSMEAELVEKMHAIAYRATKAECLDLPETTDILRQVDLEPAALRIYKGLVKESYAELSGGEVTAPNILTRLLRLSQLTGGFIGNDETASVEQVSAAKLSALEDILDGAVAEGKKLVIIARFLPEIRSICKLLEKRSLRYSCITGEVKNREEQVEQFQNEPEVMAFVGQIATAGLGITLTAASTMVFYMTDAQKENIRYLRGEGLGYRAIAARLGISENTVKSFCRRNDLTGVASKEPPQVCRHCGQPLAKAPKRKERKFCSEACRRAWWKAHPELIDRKAFYPLTCAECGKEFLSYGNRKRKYCSHACYIKARFQKGGCHDEGTV